MTLYEDVLKWQQDLYARSKVFPKPPKFIISSQYVRYIGKDRLDQYFGEDGWMEPELLGQNDVANLRLREEDGDTPQEEPT